STRACSRVRPAPPSLPTRRSSDLHKTHRDLVYLPDGRTVRAAAFPISIDAADFEELARSEAVQKRAVEIREALGNPRKVFLGIEDRKSTRLNSSHVKISYAVFCLK